MPRVLAIACVMIFCCLLSGCMTMSLHKDLSKRTKDTAVYPKCVKGKYFGEFDFEGEHYRHFYFDVFPWPSYRRGNYMHIYIPENPDKAVHVFHAEIDYGVPDTRRRWGKDGPPRTANYYYPGNSLIYLQPYEVNWQSSKRLDATLVLVTDEEDFALDSSQRLLCEQPLSRQIIMLLDKDGPGTRLFLGRKDNRVININGVKSWSKDWIWEESHFSINNRPYRGRWLSFTDNFAYVATVPLDIVTLPFQAIFYGVCYWMFSGMSPT